MERVIGKSVARAGALMVLTLLVGLIVPSNAFAEYAYPAYGYGAAVNVNVGARPAYPVRPGYPVARPGYPYGVPRGGVNVGVNIGGSHGINTYGPLAAGVIGAQRMRMGGHPTMGGCGGCHRGCGRRRCGGRGFRCFSISISFRCGGLFRGRGGCGGCGHRCGGCFHRC